MSILSDKDIFSLIRNKTLEISPLGIDQIQPASVDLRLGDDGKVIVPGSAIDLKNFSQDDVEWKHVSLENGYILHPGTCIQTHTYEKLVVPQNINAKIFGRNSLIMIGLEVLVAYINPGFDGIMPLTIKNISPVPITLHREIKICQIEFSFLASTASRPYPERHKIADLSSDDPVFDLFTQGVEQDNRLSVFLRNRIAEMSQK